MIPTLPHTTSNRRPSIDAIGRGAICLLVLMLVSCGKEEPRQQEPPRDSTEIYDLTFPPPAFPPDRKLDTILSVDLNGNGRVEYLVSSLAASTYLPPGARGDLIEIYQFDTVSRRYRVNAADSLAWIRSIELIDLTGDRTPEIVARLHAGGNDPVATEGMVIYSGEGGPLRPIFRSRGGSPAFVPAGADGRRKIVLHGELWPLFATHADAIIYIDDLLAFIDGRYQSVRDGRGDFFMKLADSSLGRYRELRARADSLPPPPAAVADSVRAAGTLGDSSDLRLETDLFNAAAISILYLQRASAARSLGSFWSSEKVFLERFLPTPFFDELGTIYTEGRRRSDAQ